MKRSSKRKRLPGKLTHADIAELHPGLAEEVLRRRNFAPTLRHFKTIPPQRRYLKPEIHD